LYQHGYCYLTRLNYKTYFNITGSGGPYGALSTSFGRLQTEYLLASMWHHLSFVDIRVFLFYPQLI